jgi:polyhydroxyalkanoate synthesis regulator protein
MNANVFQCYEEQTDRRQFSKTIEALEAYTKKNLKFAEDLAPLFAEEMEQPELELPTELPAEHTPVEQAIWDQELREFVKRRVFSKETWPLYTRLYLGNAVRP